MIGPEPESAIGDCPPARVVRAALARVARRLWVSRALCWLLRSAVAALAVVVVALLAHALGLIPDPRGGPLAWSAAVVAFVAALPGLLPVPLRAAATTADRACELRERLTTALEAIGRSGPMEQLLLRDTAQFAATLDLRRLPSGRFAREATLVVAGTAMAIVLWLAPANRSRDVPPAPVAGSARSVEAHGSRESGDTARRVETRLVEALREARQARSDGGRAPGPADAATMRSRTPSARPGARAPDSGQPAPSPPPDTTAADPRTAPPPSPASAAAGGTRASAPVERLHAGASTEAGGTGGRTVSASAPAGTAADGRPPLDQAGDRASSAPPDDGVAPAASHGTAAGSLARAGVPGGLRSYVARYFELLRTALPPPDVVAPGTRQTP